MSDFFLDEIERIGMTGGEVTIMTALDQLALSKMANVQTAAGAMNAPGSANMGGAGYSAGGGTASMGTQGPGATNMPGFSLHCNKCNAKLKKGLSQCPKCGHDVSQVRDMKKEEPDEGSSNIESGETGGEAAEAEEKAEGAYSDTGKYAAAKTKPMDPLLKKFIGLGAMGATGYGIVKLRQLLREAEQPKTASSRFGNPSFNFKGGWKRGRHGGLSSPTGAFRRMNAAASRSRERVAKSSRRHVVRLPKL